MSINYSFGHYDDDDDGDYEYKNAVDTVRNNVKSLNSNDTASKRQLSTRHIEYNALQVKRSFGYTLAEKYYQRKLIKYSHKIFLVWRTYCFRFIVLRRDLLKIFFIKKIWRHFYEWRKCCRKEVLLRKLISRKLRVFRRVRFNWWKYSVRYMKQRYRLLSIAFHKLKSDYMHDITSYYANIIKRNAKQYMDTVKYHAMKTIKRMLTRSYLFMKLIRSRRLTEKRRLQYENDTIQVMLRKGKYNLELSLLNNDGAAMKKQYLDSIDAYKKANSKADYDDKVQILPTKIELQVCNKYWSAWTSRSIALLVLEMKLEYKLKKKVIDKFRLTSPPLYACRICHETFLLKCEKMHHNEVCVGVLRLKSHLDSHHGKVQAKGGNYDPMEPTYVSWHLASDIVNSALIPLKKYIA